MSSHDCASGVATSPPDAKGRCDPAGIANFAPLFMPTSDWMDLRDGRVNGASAFLQDIVTTGLANAPTAAAPALEHGTMITGLLTSRISCRTP